MMPVTVEFANTQEVLVLRSLLNEACMAKGLEVAEACVVLDGKLLSAVRDYEARQQAKEAMEPDKRPSATRAK